MAMWAFGRSKGNVRIWILGGIMVLSFLLSLFSRCTGRPPSPKREKPSEESFMIGRKEMVERQIKARGVSNEPVLQAMLKVERHKFVPEEYQAYSYCDDPLPIGEGQTISQPYIVALMTELLDVQPGHRVLEIGTGSGYQAAILAELTDQVYSIEIVPKLAETAAERLRNLGYDKVVVKCGDGYQGWEEHAPFDSIIVTAAPDHVPQPLVDQLRMGGRLVIPVGEYYQELMLIMKTEQGIKRKTVIPVRFVPMTGEAQER
jgi:protein-L-isoaspartate(D-aspartate) O-methyltransferase